MFGGLIMLIMAGFASYRLWTGYPNPNLLGSALLLIIAFYGMVAGLWLMIRSFF